jgi:sugar phosphate isomerase/epimerase
MKGFRRRALACAATAATAATLLAGASAAQAQRPASLGDGIKTGQLSVQLFNYGSYISSGGNTGTANPITGVSAACATATTPECRAERLERLFAFLQSKGVTSVELFGHAGFPASTDIPGLQAYRALLDKYGLHAGGWHGSMNEAAWDTRVNAAKILGADYIGSGGVADPGINSYAAVLASAQALNRLGKKSVEAGVGPAYIHNHDQEFLRQYVDNGVLKTAFDIIMDNTDPRYVVAEVDVFWSSDAFDDVTGTPTAALINKYASRVQMLHIKDGINLLTPGRGGQPRATGTGELDFRPILAAANNRVRYYHQEQDGGTTTDADISFTNLKGSGPTSVATLLGLPVTFPTVPAGTPAADNVVPVVVQNTGEQPLTITNITIGADTLDAPSASEFAIVSQNCTGGPIPAGKPAVPPTQTTPGQPAVPRGTCTVNVGFKPTRANATSVARLQFTSNSDDATERVALVGKSTGDPVAQPVPVGGDVPGTLQLTIPGGTWSFGTFVPGLARNYDMSVGAQVTSTAGDALLTVADPSATSTGRLVNGSFAMAQPLALRVPTVAEPNPAYVPMPSTAGAAMPLRTYTGPVANDAVQIGFRQAIGATEPMRAGTYGKTLTFTLSTATP